MASDFQIYGVVIDDALKDPKTTLSALKALQQESAEAFRE